MIIWNLTAIKVVQAKEKGFIYDLQTKPFSLFDKRDFFSALLSRRGVFDVGSLHFNMLIFNELQRGHYKRSEGNEKTLNQKP